MKIGFLLPRSSVYPAIGYDFLDGCKSYFGLNGVQAEIVTDNIGYGLDEKEVYSKTEAMLLNSNADAVVMFASNRYNQMLAPLFTAMGRQLLIVNMGDFFPEALSSPASVIEHSFNTAFNCRLTGKLASGENNNHAVMATSYYDGGYLNVYSMVTRYQQGGGAIMHNYISHFKKEQFSTATLEEYFTSHPEHNTLLCVYSGDVSHLIYQSLTPLQHDKKLNIYVSPMMLDETLREALGNDFSIENVKGYTSWISALDNEHNRVFREEFKKFSGRKAGIFSLLGWETGILLQKTGSLIEQGLKGPELTKTMMNMQFDSPRGWLKIDPQTQQTYSPSYLVSVSGNFELKTEACIEDADDERENFTKEKPEGASSGWRNTYLCS